MLKEYTISDILEDPLKYIPYYTGTFEGTDDPDIEWPHRHAFYSIVWFTQGSGFYVVDFQEYEIKPDRIFLVGPKQVHNWDYSENSKGYVMMFDASLAAQLQINTRVSCIDVVANSSLELIFCHMIAEQQKNDILSDANIKAGITYLYAVLSRMVNNSPQISEQPRLIQQIKEAVFNNIQLVTVGEYAALIHVSEENMNNIIRSATGISAKQYILDLKIIEAKRRLIYTGDNINEIAFHLGFEDSSYFSRIFRKKTGCSPTSFLKKYRKDW